jgi:membrane protein YdbS with pleckstrin-like domain
MNERKNSWAALAAIIATFRHDPPWAKLAALIIIGVILCVVVGMVATPMTQHHLWSFLLAAVG